MSIDVASGSSRKPAPAYKVVDRSVLLPYYKKWLIAPVVGFIPASIHPNVLTNLGHLTSLTAALLVTLGHPHSGPRFFAAALLMQLYVWLDNADGAHARRTGQSSPYGELLDHGLDVLTALYVGVISGEALGLTGVWWAGVAVMPPTAAALVYWEQTRTGEMHLGAMNQVEAMLVLGGTLSFVGLVGNEVWNTWQFHGISAQAVLLFWTCASVTFGAVRGALRVATKVGGRVACSCLVPLAAVTAPLVAAATGALSCVDAVVASGAVSAYWAFHMLAVRQGREGGPGTVAYGVTIVTFVTIGVVRPELLFGPSVATALCALVYASATVLDFASVRTTLLTASED